MGAFRRRANPMAGSRAQGYRRLDERSSSFRRIAPAYKGMIAAKDLFVFGIRLTAISLQECRHLLSLHRIRRTVKQVIGRAALRDLQYRQAVDEAVELISRRHIDEALVRRCGRIELTQRSNDKRRHLLARHRIVWTVVAVAASDRDATSRQLTDILVERIVGRHVAEAHSLINGEGLPGNCDRAVASACSRVGRYGITHHAVTGAVSCCYRYPGNIALSAPDAGAVCCDVY